MANKARRNFREEFKAETVALLEASGRPLAQMSRELGIEQSVMRAWRRKLRPSGTAASRPVARVADGGTNTAPALTADQAEIRRLRRELERVRMERDILENSSPACAPPAGVETAV